jgi:hypothetical protein
MKDPPAQLRLEFNLGGRSNPFPPDSRSGAQSRLSRLQLEEMADRVALGVWQV